MLTKALFNLLRTRKVHRKKSSAVTAALIISLAFIVTGCKPSRIRTVFTSMPDGAVGSVVVDANSEGGAPLASGSHFKIGAPTVGGNYQKGIAVGSHFTVRGGALNGR